MLLKLCVLTALAGLASALVKLDEAFAWNELSFVWPDEQTKQKAMADKEYIPEHNLPLGLAKWKNKLFVTVPRWKSGVASSLAYVPVDSTAKNASLIPYPDWKANTLPKGDDKPENDNHIVSTFRLAVDACDRLWVMDTGLADILGAPKQISPPAIVVYDLNTDKLLRRYKLKSTDLKEDSFFANIIVDADKNSCDKAFAYLPDLGGYTLVVYSWADNDSWRFKHNYFHFDPLQGDFDIGGINFQWTDGIFGMALGPKGQNGARKVYFHPLASTHEFSVSSAILQNKSLASEPHIYNEFVIEGEKGEKTQTSASEFDEKSNVLIFTQLNRDGLACWNPKKKLTPEAVSLVAQDKNELIFTNDIKIDAERNIWVLSDKMPLFIYKELDPTEINYRIFKIPVDKLIAGSQCVV